MDLAGRIALLGPAVDWIMHMLNSIYFVGQPITWWITVSWWCIIGGTVLNGIYSILEGRNSN